MKESFRIVRKRLWVVVLTALLLPAVVVFVSLLLAPRYEATVEILVGQQSGLLEDPNNATGLQQLTLTMTEAVTSRPIAEEVIQRRGLGVDPEDFLEDRLGAQQIPDTQFIQVSYTGSDAQRATRVANTVGEVFVEQVSEINPDENAVSATIWAPAAVPDEPAFPNPLRDGVLAFVFGLILGLGLAFLLDYLDDSWESPEELERASGAPNFGAIPRFESRGRPRSQDSTNPQKSGKGK